MYADAHLPKHWQAAAKHTWYIHTHTACLPLLKCLSPPASTCLSTDWDDRVGPFYRLRHTSVSSTFTQSQLWSLGNLCFRGRYKGSPSMRTLRFSGHIYKGLGTLCVRSLPSQYAFFLRGFAFLHCQSLRKQVPACFPTYEGADYLACNSASRKTGRNHWVQPGRDLLSLILVWIWQ